LSWRPLLVGGGHGTIERPLNGWWGVAGSAAKVVALERAKLEMEKVGAPLVVAAVLMRNQVVLILTALVAEAPRAEPCSLSSEQELLAMEQKKMDAQRSAQQAQLSQEQERLNADHRHKEEQAQHELEHVCSLPDTLQRWESHTQALMTTISFSSAEVGTWSGPCHAIPCVTVAKVQLPVLA